MPEKKLTLNRFPLFGLFAYRAAKKLGYPEEDEGTRPMNRWSKEP